MSRECRTQSKLRDLVIFQPIRDRERDFFRALLVVFVVAYIVRCYVVGVAVGVDGDEVRGATHEAAARVKVGGAFPTILATVFEQRFSDAC